MSGIERLFWVGLVVMLLVAAFQSPTFGVVIGGAALCGVVVLLVNRRPW